MSASTVKSKKKSGISPMPSKIVDKLMEEVTELRRLFTDHLADSGNVKTDIAWLKRSFWVIATASVTSAFALVVQLVLFLVKR